MDSGQKTLEMFVNEEETGKLRVGQRDGNEPRRSDRQEQGESR